MGPYEHAIFDRTYRWGKVVATNSFVDSSSLSQDASPKELRHQTTKSEAWMYVMCSGNCPTNCTGFSGEMSPWGYVKKSVNPFRRDQITSDPRLKVMCKGISV